MHRLIIISIFLLLASSLRSQSDMFILIDVSGNPLSSSNKINNSERKQAIELCKQLIEGSVNRSAFNNWEAKNLKYFVANAYNTGNGHLLKKINSITIVPYGNKYTYEKFKIFQYSNARNTLQQAIDYAYSFTYNDQLTFGELARAKAADIAIDANIKTYYLLEISGLGGDQTGSKSLSRKQQQLIDEYKSSAETTPIGLFILKNKPLRINAKIVNITSLSGNTNTTGSKGIITQNNIIRKSLKILSPIGTKTDHDKVDEKNGLHISWQCLGCDNNTEYTVSATNIKTHKTKKVKVVGQYHTLLQLAPATYTISIKGKGGPGCQNNRQYVEIKGKTKAGGWVFFLVLILLLTAAFYLKKNDPFGWWDKDKKKEKKTNDNNDDFDSLY